MEFYEAVNKRRSVREFQTRPVEVEKLMRILEAGLKAPSNNHLRQWEFILVRDPEQRRRVAELVAKGKSITSEMELEKPRPRRSSRDEDPRGKSITSEMELEKALD